VDYAAVRTPPSLLRLSVDGVLLEVPVPHGGAVLVGRSSRAQVRLTDSRVSALHCRLVDRGSALTLEDLGSRHGTLLNGRPLHGARAVKRGDQVQVGSATFVIRDVVAARAAPIPAALPHPLAPPTARSTPHTLALVLFLIGLLALALGVLLMRQTSDSPVPAVFAVPTSPPFVTTVPASAAPPLPTAAPALPAAVSPPALAAGPTTTTGAGAILYQADWSSGMNGWIGGPQWKVVSNMLVNDGSGDGFIVAPYAATTSDYAIEVEVQVLRGDNFLLYLRQPDNRGTDVGYSLQFYDGQTLLNSAAVSHLAIRAFSFGTGWHTYRLEAQANSVRALVDGTPWLSSTDNRYLDGRYVALRDAGAQINVRSFRIMAL